MRFIIILPLNLAAVLVASGCAGEPPVGEPTTVPRAGHPWWVDHIDAVSPNKAEAPDPAEPRAADDQAPAKTNLIVVGEPWARSLSKLLKAHIAFPTTIPQDELPGYRCRVSFKIGCDLIPHSVKLLSSSGSTEFDHAVVEALEGMTVKNVKIPPPPPELEDYLFNKGIELTVSGQHRSNP